MLRLVLFALVAAPALALAQTLAATGAPPTNAPTLGGNTGDPSSTTISMGRTRSDNV